MSQGAVRCCRCYRWITPEPFGPVVCEACRRALHREPTAYMGVRGEPRRAATSHGGARDWT